MKKGSILLDPDFVANWSAELKTMNEAKEGARFRYPELFVKLLAVVHAYILPYRCREGFTGALNQQVHGLKAPDYTNKIIRTLKIRNMSIILCTLFSLPIFLLTRLFLFPF